MSHFRKDKLPLQVHVPPSTNVRDSCLRALKAVQALAQARARLARNSAGLEATSRAPAVTKLQEAALLGDALRATPFGQAVDLGVLTRLAPYAELKLVAGGTTVELCGNTDALYMVLTGSAEIMAGPSRKARVLQVTVEAAQGLLGDSETDRLDPYVVVKVGAKQFKSQVMTDAGADPRWSWTVNIPYSGEPEVEFVVMEYDAYSRHDILGVASVSHIDFTCSSGITDWLSLSRMSDTMGGTASVVHMNSVNVNNPAENVDLGKLQVAISMTEAPGPASGIEHSVSRASDLRSTGDLARTGDPMSPGPKAKGRGISQVLDTMLGPGQHFGTEDGGGTLRTLEDCQMMFVPRVHVSEAFRASGEEIRNERDAFLKKHLPGMNLLDARTFASFASAWQHAFLPRGHTLCAAGSLLGGDEARRVYVLVHGACQMRMPPPPREEMSGPRRGSMQEPFRSSAAATPVGLLGPGAILGYASSLFEVPEPFSAVAEEHVSVLWLGIDARPLSGWPRDVVFRLQEMLKARTEWHTRRTHNIQTSITASNGLKEVGGDRMPVQWTAADSPKLRYKELSLWRAETLRDRFDAEGWHGGPPPVFKSHSPKGSSSHGALPGGLRAPGASPMVASKSQMALAGATTPTGVSGTSSPVHHSSVLSVADTPSGAGEPASREPKGAGCGPRGSPPRAVRASREPASREEPPWEPKGGAVRGIYAVNSGLGRCKTPWGTWEPSGMLPANKNPESSRITGSRHYRKGRAGMVVSMKSSGPASSEEATSQKHGELRKVNLKCPSDWQQLSGLASSASLGKMYKQRLRTSTIQGAFASGDGSAGMAHSFSDGALR